jgi:hypothetical protein
MILNIIDHRERPYRWQRIKAIVEPTWHDNGVRDSDHAARGLDDFIIDHREDVSLAEAIAWANGLAQHVTLYLYDAGG